MSMNVMGRRLFHGPQMENQQAKGFFLTFWIVGIQHAYDSDYFLQLLDSKHSTCISSRGSLEVRNRKRSTGRFIRYLYTSSNTDRRYHINLSLCPELRCVSHGDKSALVKKSQ